MDKYVIYHKFGGYLMSSGDYTDKPSEAVLFDTKESAEIEIAGYLERVEKIDMQ